MFCSYKDESLGFLFSIVYQGWSQGIWLQPYLSPKTRAPLSPGTSLGILVDVFGRAGTAGRTCFISSIYPSVHTKIDAALSMS